MDSVYSALAYVIFFKLSFKKTDIIQVLGNSTAHGYGVKFDLVTWLSSQPFCIYLILKLYAETLTKGSVNLNLEDVAKNTT